MGSYLLPKMGNLEAEKQKKDIFDYIKYFKDFCKENDTKIKSMENIHLKII